MPKISVISIAKTNEELDELKKLLSLQKYKDFEFIGSTKGTIPEAWNDAISRAKGEYLVFTETDAKPVNEKWLEEIDQQIRINPDYTILKGIEVSPTNFNMCNLVGKAEIFRKNCFDENFNVCEDTELFARLRYNGIQIIRVPGFPVFHSPSISWRKTIKRSFTYGHLFIKIIYKYGLKNIDNINTMENGEKKIHPVSNRFRVIFENCFILLGLIFGLIFHITSFNRKKRITSEKYCK
jgi:hypothetical protein